jgi:hypothetical protein
MAVQCWEGMDGVWDWGLARGFGGWRTHVAEDPVPAMAEDIPVDSDWGHLNQCVRRKRKPWLPSTSKNRDARAYGAEGLITESLPFAMVVQGSTDGL